LLASGYFAVLALTVAAVLPPAIISLRRVNERTNELLPARASAQAFLTHAVDQETGERGYVITGQSSFLQPYVSGLQRTRDDVAQLERLKLTSDERIALRNATDALDRWRVNGADPEIAATRAGDSAKARMLVSSGAAKQLFDEFRTEQASLSDLIDARARQSDRDVHAASVFVLAMLGLCAVVVGALAFIFARALRRAAREEDDSTRSLADAENLQRTIASVTSAMASARTVSEVSRAAVTGIGDAVAAPFGSVRIVDESTGAVYFAATYGMTDTLNKEWEVYSDNPNTPVSMLVKTRKRMTVTKADYTKHYPKIADATAAAGVEAILYVPVLQAGDVIAVISLGLPDGRPAAVAYAEATLDTLAPIVGEAIARAQLFEGEQQIAATLQNAMLGQERTDDERVSVAARYRAASQDLFVGGDWYDCIELANDRLALIVGDAVGHGVEATAAMGQLRSAAAGLAEAVSDPAVLMRHLETFARRTPAATCATCLIVILDLAAPRVQYVSAGHPPALVIDPDGTTTFLDDVQGPPLAAGVIDRRRHSGERSIEFGTTVVLYTDGLVERRRESIDVGLERLRATAARDRAQPVEEMCDRLLRDLLTEETIDDVAIVAVRLEQARSHRFTRRIDSDPAKLGPLRHDFARWLDEWSVPSERADGMLVAVGEAVANSVEHAYPLAEPGVVVLDAGIDDDDMLRVTVRDHGTWREPVADPMRGRGRQLMKEFADEFEIRSEPVGTLVSLSFNLNGSTRP
jgi:CHASE3 domain sensor protein/anti-sigma regulatory factor (Ser/Thr protein kinase)